MSWCSLNAPSPSDLRAFALAVHSSYTSVPCILTGLTPLFYSGPSPVVASLERSSLIVTVISSSFIIFLEIVICWYILLLSFI